MAKPTTSILNKVARAYEYAPMDGVYPDHESVASFVETAPFVTEEGDGFLIGAIYPFHLNRSVLIAAVLMMDGCGGGQVMLERFTKWAKRRGASLLQVSVADFDSDPFFAERGYREVEHMHMRGI